MFCEALQSFAAANRKALDLQYCEIFFGVTRSVTSDEWNLLFFSVSALDVLFWCVSVSTFFLFAASICAFFQVIRFPKKEKKDFKDSWGLSRVSERRKWRVLEGGGVGDSIPRG